MAFNVTYSGENTAVKLPDLDKLIRSQERVGDMAIAGQEKLLQRKEKDSAFVLEQMKANPVLLISDKLRTQQAEAIKTYNDYGAKLLQQGDGVLSDDAKLALQRNKEALVMMQQTMQADQGRFQQEYALMQKDQGAFYDEKEFKKAMDVFYETGQYPPTALIAKPKDAFALLGSLKPVSETRVPQEGDTGYDVTSKMTVDQAKLAIRNTMLRDEGSVRGFLKVFESLPEEEQMAVLDTNVDGAIDPTERQAVKSEMDINNPIVQWAESYEPFIQQAMGMKTVPRTATQEKGKTTPTTPFKTTIPVGSGNNRNLDFSEVTVGKTKGNWTFDTWVDLDKSTTGSISINEWYSPDDTATKLTGDNNVVLDLIGYSPSQDKIVARVKSADLESSLFEDDVVILDGDRYDSLLRRELKIHRQGFKSFGQGAAKTGQGSFQGSYVEYKKKYPNGTPEEYRTLTGAK